jgi:DNA-binding response OmpR family regulator
MRILIVEDEKEIAEMIKKGLSKAGYIIDSAYDGKKGFFMAKTEPYAVIILDIMLPEMDGITLCKKLRELEINSFIIMLTARDLVEDKIHGLEAGADDYITKPFSFEELIIRIQNLLKRRNPERIEIIKVGDMTLNTATREVKVRTKTVELSNKEYLILEHLMRNAGKVVSRENILENVWDYEYDSFSNIVDVYIRYLRRKLDSEKKGGGYIQTVKGAGYKFVKK